METTLLVYKQCIPVNVLVYSGCGVHSAYPYLVHDTLFARGACAYRESTVLQLHRLPKPVHSTIRLLNFRLNLNTDLKASLRWPYFKTFTHKILARVRPQLGALLYL